MGIIGEAIKNKVNNYDKYNQSQEKVAQVLDIDTANNVCTISIISRDGIPEVVNEVPVKKSPEGLFQWRPAAGELVQVAETNKRLMIIDKFYENVSSDNRAIRDDNYSSFMNGAAGGFSGM